MRTVRAGRNACGSRELPKNRHAYAHQNSAETEGQDGISTGKHHPGNHAAQTERRCLSEIKFIGGRAHAQQSAMRYQQRRT